MLLALAHLDRLVVGTQLLDAATFERLATILGNLELGSNFKVARREPNCKHVA